MITQKQIDTRDEYIKKLESIIKNCLPNTAVYILHDYARNKSAISDADKEAAGLKDEMLNALIHQYRWVKSLYDLYRIDERAFPDSDLITTERDLRELIERATDLTIDEAIKVWEAE